MGPLCELGHSAALLHKLMWLSRSEEIRELLPVRASTGPRFTNAPRAFDRERGPVALEANQIPVPTRRRCQLRRVLVR